MPNIATRLLSTGSLLVNGSFDEQTDNLVYDSTLTLYLNASKTTSYSGTGTTWADLSGNAYDTTLIGSPTYSAGAIVFNASVTTQYANVPIAAIPSGGSQVSVCCWINLGNPATPPAASVFSCSNSAGNRIINIHLPWNDSIVYWDAGNTGATYDRINTGILTLAQKTGWHHWAFTKNATAGTMAIYLDGASVVTGTGKTLTLDTVSTAISPCAIANFQGTSNWNGSVSSFEIYNVALTAAQVAQNYSATSAPFTKFKTTLTNVYASLLDEVTGITTSLTANRLYSWGYNTYGQLGLGDAIDRSSPQQVGSLTTWSTVAGGAYHTMATKTDGTLWSWGLNDSGQLGTSNVINRSSPQQVGALTTWSTVAAGQYHTMATKTDGTLWSWGYNAYGQLGLGDTIDRSSPQQVGALTTWLTIVGGAYYTMATKTDGTLWSWGLNDYGQLGTSNVINRSSPQQVGALTTWSKIAAGRLHTMATKTTGALWSWGYNAYGQLGLGLGPLVYRSSPVQVGALTTWLTVAAGKYHSLATKTTGALWSWGYNISGQLGTSNVIYRSSPVQVGALTTWLTIAGGVYHTMATKTDGTLWSWGSSFNSQLGLGDNLSRSSPQQVGALTTWSTVAAGGYHSIAVTSDITITNGVKREISDGTLQVKNIFDEFTGAPVVDSNLMLWLDAAQTASYPGSGATWTDLSPTPKNYTLTASPTFNSIIGGGVITFAGASSQYATSASSLFNSTTYPAYTISLWVYPTGAGNFVQVDGQAALSTGYYYSAIEISAAGIIKFGQWTGAGITTIATSTQSLNTWYNLVITYASTLATAYVNGASVGTSATAWSAPGASTFMALMATSGTAMGTVGYASGNIGAFMVYNRALSADEITTNFNALNRRYGI